MCVTLKPLLHLHRTCSRCRLHTHMGSGIPTSWKPPGNLLETTLATCIPYVSDVTHDSRHVHHADEATVGTPIANEKVPDPSANGEIRTRERVMCPGEFLSGAEFSPKLDRRGLVSYPPLVHLKASARYPTHEHAFSQLHDCLTVAELAHLHRAMKAAAVGSQHNLNGTMHQARKRIQMITSQILWSHGAKPVHDVLGTMRL